MNRSERDRLDLEHRASAHHVLANPAALDDEHGEHATSSGFRRARSRALVAACGVVLWLVGASLSLPTPSPELGLQPTAAQASDAPRRPGLSSETLDADLSDKPANSRAERAKARKEAAKAKHDEAHAKHLAAAQARKEAADEKREAAKAKHTEAHAKYVAAMQARKEAADEKREADKAKHDEAHAKYAAAMQARKEAADEKREAAKAKHDEAHAKYVAAMQARKDAAEARLEAKRQKADDAAPQTASSSAAFDAGAVAAAPAPTSGSAGTLRINSLPWAEVYVDGRKVGNTPQRALSVSAGEHDVRLVNNAFDMVASFHVRVAKGQSITRGVMLDER